MELVFLFLLIVLMMSALMSGFPVGFALPGSSILCILAAALCGWLFEGDSTAYFYQGGAFEWMSAGVTNLRSLYWDVERDTLIAIPLFIFMGIMLQRSRIAEDLLVSMALLFGPLPGGLGISVVFVGALLAATTGIVGATVIAMGLISLPAMLKNNYSKPLASGIVLASGTLGTIIPPSIVLIILADQLANAASKANSARNAEYRFATGELTMPSQFDVVSASAGNMFMGALMPGLVLVGLFMVYIFIFAMVKPSVAPPVPYEGKYDLRFWLRLLLALVPPLVLIITVLGSIIAGIATVNQAGAIGAMGALIMGGYRLTAGKRGSFAPAILAVISLVGIWIVMSVFDINVKRINSVEDIWGIVFASITTFCLLVSVLWSLWRAYVIEEMLKSVMMETAKITSLVFIILLGAAMLTSAFRAFGGEALIRDFLTSLPGGFWSQFIVVMVVIFLLGFFLDFFEIAVVVVPIVAPILLSSPEANITAVWLGVMIGVNIQTSFLTPPFGFALFYLRGVATAVIKTIHIYKGAAAFICLQLIGLTIAGVFPSLVNYLPNRMYLSSEMSPPPTNPKLQYCVEKYVFAYYDDQWDELRAAIDRAATLSDASYLPEPFAKKLGQSFDQARASFDMSKDVRAADAAMNEYVLDYRPLHKMVRRLQSDIRKIERDIERLKWDRSRLRYDKEASDQDRKLVEERMIARESEIKALEQKIPVAWKKARKGYLVLEKAQKNARRVYLQNVDDSYRTIQDARKLIADAGALEAFAPTLASLDAAIVNQAPAQAGNIIKAAEKELSQIHGSSSIKSLLTKARRVLRGDSPKRDEAAKFLVEARERFSEEVAWRKRAANGLEAGLSTYNDAIKYSIGLRLQDRLNLEQASTIAECKSVHRDISLSF